MADLNWNEVVRDTARFPDTMLIDMGEGRGNVRLGELRQAFVPRTEADNWRTRAGVYADEKRVLEGHLAQMLQALPQHPQPQQPAGAAPPVDFTADPILNPLHQQGLEAIRLAQENARSIQKLEKLAEQNGQMWQALPQLIMMGQMKQADPALDIDALNRFRAEHKITDPVLAARAMNYDRDLAKAREVAEAQALDKARSEVAALAPAVPYAPYGPPHTLQIPEPGFKTIDESEIAALQDPEILRLWQPSAA